MMCILLVIKAICKMANSYDTHVFFVNISGK